MTKREYNRKKRKRCKALKLEERAYRGTAQSYSGIMFGPVLHRRTGLERFRAQKPALNVDGKPCPVSSVGRCHTLIIALYAQQVERRGDHNKGSNRAIQTQADKIRARLPVMGR